MTDIRNKIAYLIRRHDPGNRMSANLLGKVLGQALAPDFSDLHADDIVRFVERFDPARTLTAGALAAAIVDEFDLDEEN